MQWVAAVSIFLGGRGDPFPSFNKARFDVGTWGTFLDPIPDFGDVLGGRLRRFLRGHLGLIESFDSAQDQGAFGFSGDQSWACIAT